MAHFTGSVYNEAALGDLIPIPYQTEFGLNTEIIGRGGFDNDQVYLDVAAPGEAGRHPRAAAPGSTVNFTFSINGATALTLLIFDSNQNLLFEHPQTSITGPSYQFSASVDIPYGVDYIYFDYPIGILLGDAQYSLKIDGQATPKPTVSFSKTAVDVLEGDAGSQIVYFDVTLSEKSKEPVTVSYYTQGGTAEFPDDYASTSGLITFAPGKTTQRISVQVKGDSVVEETESFRLWLENPTNAILGADSVIVTINDNEVRDVPLNDTPLEDVMAVAGEKLNEVVTHTAGAIDTHVNLPENFQHTNLKYTLATDGKWTSWARSVGGAAKVLGPVAEVIGAYVDGWNAYLQGGETAGKRALVVALVSGAVGGAAGVLVSGFVLGAAVPLIAGIAVGYGTKKAFEFGINSFAEAPPTPQQSIVPDEQASSHVGAAPSGNTFGPFTLGATMPTPQWEYNPETDTFKWLKKPNAAVIARIETQLGFNDNPLTLKGDADKLDKADLMMGGGGNDSIDGVTADDVIFGKGGNDKLIGGLGRDILAGGDGDDVLDGGPGNDLLDGGAGLDTATYATLKVAVAADLAAGAATYLNGAITETDLLMDIENLVGGGANDRLVGDAASNVIEGGLGNDTLIGGGNGQAGDTVSYAGSKKGVTVDLAIQNGVTAQNTVGAGLDILSGFENVIGSAGIDIIRGDAGNNKLFGGLNKDTLNGGDGDDWLIGGAGVDTLTGGAGIDIFHMDVLEKAGDQIIGFERGVDKLSFKPSVFVGVENATLVKSGAPAASGPGPVFLFDTDDGRLLWDADGSGKGAAMHVATLQGVGDFSLDDITALQPSMRDAGEDDSGDPDGPTDPGDPTDPINGTRFPGTTGDDNYVGGALNDSFRGKTGADIFTGNGGADHFIFDRISDQNPLMDPPPWMPQPTDRIDTITDFQTGVDKIILEAVGALAGLKSPSLQIIEVTNGGATPVTAGPTLLIYEPYPRAGTPYDWPGWLAYQADGFGPGESYLAAGNIITQFAGVIHASDIVIG